MNTNHCASGCAGPCNQGRLPCPNREPSYPQSSQCAEAHWNITDALIAAALVATIVLVCIGA